MIGFGFGYGYAAGRVGAEVNVLPSYSTAMFWLDGTVVTVGEAKYFKDKKGTRNFLITGCDFTGNGFPYKSAATISAPTDDAALIAADLNGFLYTEGVPNQIPVVSLFQDVDYEHRLFCKHLAQVVDANGVETSEPKVTDIVLYSDALVTTDLTKAQTFYGVPVEDATAKWVAVSGNDTTGDGSKAKPWLTLTKAEASAINGDLIYVKSGVYIETNFFYPRLERDWTAIGNVTVKSSGTTYVVFTNNATNKTISGFTFDGETNTTNILYAYTPAVFDRCKFVNSKVDGQSISIMSVTTFTNTIVADGRIEIAKGFSFDTCYFNSYMFGDGLTGQFERFTNCKIIVNTATTASWSGTINSVSEFTLKGCDITVVDCGYFIISTGGITSTLSVIFCKINIIDYETSFINNATGGFSDIIISDNIITKEGTYGNILSNGKNVTIERNTLVNMSAKVSGDIGAGSDIVINDNRIVINTSSGYGVAVGKENTPTTQANSITILRNIIYGEKYYNPLAEPTLHGIFVGYQAAVTNIQYNYVNGCGIGVVLKGSNTDYANTIVQYNIITNSQLYGVYCKAVNNAKIYNNTLVENRYEICLGANVGGDDAVGIVIKNNIFHNTSGIIYELGAGSIAGVQIIDTNTIYYTDALANELNLTEWIALSYDVNSNTDNPNLTNFIPATPITGAEDLGTNYDDGLDVITDWAVPTIVTKQQGAEWQMGAYVI